MQNTYQEDIMRKHNQSQAWLESVMDFRWTFLFCYVLPSYDNFPFLFFETDKKTCSSSRDTLYFETVLGLLLLNLSIPNNTCIYFYFLSIFENMKENSCTKFRKFSGNPFLDKPIPIPQNITLIINNDLSFKLV